MCANNKWTILWEQSSKPLSVSTAIPIDAARQAHVYKIILSVYSKIYLVNSVQSVKPDSVRDFYANIDRCM